MSLIATLPATVPDKKASPFAWMDVLRRPAERTWSAVLILLVLCGFLFFYGLTAGEFYRTESLRAIVAAEFLRSGDWMVPTLYGEPLLTKPPGMYAAIALVSWPFGGVCEWTARLPSALAATITVFLFYWYFGRQLGRLGGLVAAVIVPTSFMWLDKATSAEIDMLQVAWVSAAILCFLRALEIAEGKTDETANQRHPGKALFSPNASEGFWWLAALLCVAGGVLTKWTAPAFFYGTVVPLLWWRKRLRLLLRRHHLLSAALGASICLGWAATAMCRVGWDTFYETVGREASMHLSPGHNPRPYPWGETLGHPFLLLAANLPWSGFALITLWPGFAGLWDERGRRLLQALHCWTWPNMLLWDLVPEHSARHSFPLFPGMAGLAALVWVAWLTGRMRWPNLRAGGIAVRTPGRVLVLLVALWLVVKLAFVHIAIPGRNLNRDIRAKGRQIAARVPEGQTLYLFRLKDEGIMFYYGRAARRLAGRGQLPSSDEPLYCILDETEWRQWSGWPGVETVLKSADGQGQPIALVRVILARPPGGRTWVNR